MKLAACLLLSVLCFVENCFALGEFECKAGLAQPEQQKLIQAVEARYQKFVDLQAEFIQQSYFLGLDQQVISRGRVFFKRPGMMDWVYEEPEKQRFIADGTTLWFYQPELNQVTLGDFKEAFNSDLPVSFLLGIARLRKNFELDSACKASGGIVLGLSARTPDPSLEEFYLLVDADTHIPVGAKVVDIGGNETMITFQRVKLDGKVDKKQFQFNIPRGVDIIDNRGRRKSL